MSYIHSECNDTQFETKQMWLKFKTNEHTYNNKKYDPYIYELLISICYGTDNIQDYTERSIGLTNKTELYYKIKIITKA